MKSHVATKLETFLIYSAFIMSLVTFIFGLITIKRFNECTDNATNKRICYEYAITGDL